MGTYNIYAGLGGGFGGENYIETIRNIDEDSAMNMAYEAACEEYEGFGGLHGLFNREEALEEDPDLSDEELDEMESEDRKFWIEYHVEETADEDEDEDDYDETYDSEE